MNSGLRTSIIAGAVAAALSILVGLFSRVDFLPLLLRALAFGIAFGGLAWGALFLLGTYLPELFEAGAARGAAQESVLAESFPDSEAPALGGNLDIVLGTDDEEDEDLAAAAAPPPPSPVEADAEAAQPSFLEDAEDLDEGEGFASGPAERKPAAPVVPAARATPGFDDLDMLPDLDSLSEEFGDLGLGAGAAPKAGGEAPSEPYPSSGRTVSRSPVAGPGGADPAALAMAVRTILKRDQKG